MDYKGHKLYLQNKDGKFEEFTYEMAIETMIGQTQVADELQNRINKVEDDLKKSLKFNRINEYKNYICMDIDHIYYLIKTLEGAETNETNNNN